LLGVRECKNTATGDTGATLASQTARAREVLSRHADELRVRFGLKQLSVGYLRSGDSLSGQVGIVCFVGPGEEVQGLDGVPKEIEGVPVQVIRLGEKFSPR